MTTPAGDAGFPTDAQVAPVNNFLQSVFAKVDVMLNGKKRMLQRQSLRSQRIHRDTS